MAMAALIDRQALLLTQAGPLLALQLTGDAPLAGRRCLLQRVPGMLLPRGRIHGPLL